MQHSPAGEAQAPRADLAALLQSSLADAAGPGWPREYTAAANHHSAHSSGAWQTGGAAQQEPGQLLPELQALLANPAVQQLLAQPQAEVQQQQQQQQAWQPQTSLQASMAPLAGSQQHLQHLLGPAQTAPQQSAMQPAGSHHSLSQLGGSQQHLQHLAGSQLPSRSHTPSQAAQGGTQHQVTLLPAQQLLVAKPQLARPRAIAGVPASCQHLHAGLRHVQPGISVMQQAGLSLYVCRALPAPTHAAEPAPRRLQASLPYQPTLQPQRSALRPSSSPCTALRPRHIPFPSLFALPLSATAYRCVHCA